MAPLMGTPADGHPCPQQLCRPDLIIAQLMCMATCYRMLHGTCRHCNIT